MAKRSSEVHPKHQENFDKTIWPKCFFVFAGLEFLNVFICDWLECSTLKSLSWIVVSLKNLELFWVTMDEQHLF